MCTTCGESRVILEGKDAWTGMKRSSHGGKNKVAPENKMYGWENMSHIRHVTREKEG